MGAFAQKAEFTYKYANNLPVTHPMNVRAKEMADAIRAETKGRVDIQIYPNNQLGSDGDMLSQLRSGGIEFFTLSGLILGQLVPASQISGVGFAFPDYATVWKAMDGELGAWIRAQILKKDLVAMDKIWDNGFRQTTSSSASPSTRRTTSRASRSACRCRRCGRRCSRPSTRRRRRSTSPRCTRRCRPRWSKARRTRWPSSPPPSCTRCRSTAR